jgi:phosphoglycolate phosphatase
MHPMLTYDLAVFDFDGTLADSAPWFLDILGEVAERFGFRAVGDDEIEELRACGTREIVRRLEVPTWKLPFIARYMRKRARIDADRIALFPGVDEAFRTLKERGLRIAIVSSNSEENIRRTLGPDLAALVTAYGCGSSLFGKTAKLRKTAKRCGVSPARTIFVGDEIRDVEAARAVGTASGAVLWGYAAPVALESLKPTLILRQMSDLHQL